VPDRRKPVVRSFPSDCRESRLLTVGEEGGRVHAPPFLTEPD